MNKVHIEERLRERFSAPEGSNPRILVFGIGTHGGGAGVLRFFHALGWHVVAVDEKPESHFQSVVREFSSASIDWKFGPAQDSLLAHIDVVIKNPGVPMEHPFIAAAKRKGVRVTNDVDIFLTAVDTRRVIGVTGTKGKTTTALLIAHILGKKHRAIAVGVPGVSFFDAVLLSKMPDYIVAECSSYDLELATASPHVAVLTSLAGDHISRHGSMRAYVQAKTRLFRFQKKGDIAILPKILPYERLFIKTAAKKIRFRATPPAALGQIPWYIHHNSVSAAFATCAALGLGQKEMIKRMATFRAVPGRRERIFRSKNGVQYINDTTATAPIAAIDTIQSAARAYGAKHVIPIVGGHDKELVEREIATLAKMLISHTKHFVLLDGTFTARLIKYLPNGHTPERTMEAAVTAASQMAAKGDYVILTPGCASFNMFKNEFDRGDQFKASVVHY